MGPDEREIREVHSTWIDAVNAGDLVRLLTLMADDVVFLNPGRAPFWREGFSANFSAAHQQVRIRCISESPAASPSFAAQVTHASRALAVSARPAGSSTQRSPPPTSARQVA